MTTKYSDTFSRCHYCITHSECKKSLNRQLVNGMIAVNTRWLCQCACKPCRAPSTWPRAILKHEELQSVFTHAELGALVPQKELNQLEDQYLTHKEVNTLVQKQGQVNMGSSLQCGQFNEKYGKFPLETCAMPWNFHGSCQKTLPQNNNYSRCRLLGSIPSVHCLPVCILEQEAP